MKSNLLATLVAGLLLTSPVFAQHGRGGMGPMSSGNMGNSSNAGHDNSAKANPNENGVGPKTQDQLLSPTSKLASNLQKLLPQGLTPQQACQGFRNLGQCVAAIHVSHNLKSNVNFYCLKADMTGSTAGIPQGTTCPAGTATSTKGMSLGQSIHQLDPQANAKAAAATAQRQASHDLKQS